jgi:hypothetical protein
MNKINSSPLKNLGYGFIPQENLPAGENEYYLRNIQNDMGISYQALTSDQLQVLIDNKNVSDDWSKVLVAENFNAEQVKHCTFYGEVRIGNLEPVFREFHDFKMPVGLYHSTIISCDFGHNVCVQNVSYLSHFIISDDVMIANVGELATTNCSKFGNGILKEGDEEKQRTWLEVCNENGGRNILPFNSMLTGDAYLWSRYRENKELMAQFVNFTDKELDQKKGYYGKIGERTVIKNCSIIKDVWIGSDAYIKGANKIKNVTINSDSLRKSQIGEGCEIVNGIVGFGCRIFYGAKAVRFVMGSHSQLKYGARLINSFLGNNSTISCCEVLNSLIFPSHEQHHNNSFLCASMVMGQSNIAAGVTIGSNHNSRAADGEIIAGRGFWPGLCVSLKHNSKFASFTLLAKGDYPTEMRIPIPFSLVSIDAASDQTVVMPAYWFMYNMYALERNAWKATDRDRRTEKIQYLDTSYLAPDTINEIFEALNFLEKLSVKDDGSAEVFDWENGNRCTKIIKVKKSIAIFKEMIAYYFGYQVLQYYRENKDADFISFKSLLKTETKRTAFENVGGQLISETVMVSFRKKIVNNDIENWQQVHDFYRAEGILYASDKLQHAYTSYLELTNLTHKQFDEKELSILLDQVLKTNTWVAKSIVTSREKDYTNPFRKMVYDNDAQMDEVLGKIEDNDFIQQQLKALDENKKLVAGIVKGL